MPAIHRPGQGETLLQRFQVQLGQSEHQRAEPNPLKRLARFLVAFTLPFALYALTAAPTVYYWDSAEFTVAAATGGFVHPTGYPLYLILGWLWTRIPVGDMGFRMNLFSAVNGALTVALVAEILRRFRVRPWALWGSLGLLTTGYYFWALSLIAEVYTLHTVMMALIILFALRWNDDPSPQRLAGLAGIVGLSFGNHASTVLLLPGLAVFIVSAHRKTLTLKNLALAAGAFALGLSLYLYLPIRYAADPVFNPLKHYDGSGRPEPVNLQSVEGLWSVVSGQIFQQLMLSEPNVFGAVLGFAEQLARDFWFIGLGPAVLGLVLLIKRDQRIGSMALFMFGIHALFYIQYQVSDRVTMFLPNYVIMALWSGIGLDDIFASLEDVKPVTTAVRVTWLIRLLLIATVVLGLAWNWRLVNLSDNYEARHEGERILARLDPNAAILGHWDIVPVLEYLQLIEGRRHDVLAINFFQVSPEDREDLIKTLLHERPVYVDKITSDMMRAFTFVYSDGLYQLSPKEVPMP